jgi:hypothetical protein
MSLVSRWTQSISRASRNGMALSRAVYGAMQQGKGATSTASETIKSVLLVEARREPLPNNLAISILKIDKEVGLVRYWGLAEYLKQNQPAFSFASFSSKLFSGNISSVTDSADNISNNNNDVVDTSAARGGGASPRPTHGAARVAFMITSSMKRDLIDGLGYQASVVKGMTPKQASLVLHHRLSSDSYDEKIPGLEKALEKELTLQQQKQTIRQRLEASEALEEPERDPRTASTDSTIESSETSSHFDSSVRSSSPVGESSSDRSGEVPLMLSSSSSHASQDSSSPPLSSTPLSPSSSTDNDSSAGAFFLDETKTDVDVDSDLWYEVVEVRDEGTETTNEIRHGLYRDREEALLGLETRQSILSKRGKERQGNIESDVTERTTFVLRPISGNDL